ncbi:MAG: Ig-like domain-containing protein [Ruminococcus sp.]|nr:Ig-like domain-containing protein [Ruminococcus sp.]
MKIRSLVKTALMTFFAAVMMTGCSAKQEETKQEEKTVDITGIVLSTNNVTMKVDEKFQLNYSLFPDNAVSDSITWKSADETVAGVNNEGYITALKAGQTTIIASSPNGIMATCSVTIEEKAAYDRLASYEKEFVDALLKYINSFKNPQSVTVTGVKQNGSGEWWVEINAMNGFGGYSNQGYVLTSSKMQESDIISTSGSTVYDIDLINQAIKEKMP